MLRRNLKTGGTPLKISIIGQNQNILTETRGSTREPVYPYSTRTLMDGSGFLRVWVWVALPTPGGIPVPFPISDNLCPLKRQYEAKITIFR